MKFVRWNVGETSVKREAFRARAVVRVLAYHSLQDLAGQPVVEAYGTPPEQFQRQIRMLQHFGFRFIDGERFLDFLHGRRCVPPLTVLLTFDDCYDDLLESGLPILLRLGVPAIAFAVSSRLGKSNIWDENKGAPTIRLLSAEGLQILASHGVEIGAHSRTHRLLSEASIAELEDEVSGSITELESQGIKRPRLFAYPYGDSNASVRATLQNAEVEAGFTTDPGYARQNRDRLLVPRIEILRHDKGWRFLYKVIRGM